MDKLIDLMADKAGDLCGSYNNALCVAEDMLYVIRQNYDLVPKSDVKVMDDHRKLAEEIANKFSHLFAITGSEKYSLWYRLVDEIENALRTTASKSEKDGWNKAVVECAKLVSNHWNNSEAMCNQHDQAYRSADAIRSLIREE